MDWKEEYNTSVYNSTIINNNIYTYGLIKAVEECTANYVELGDVEYKLPSKAIRKLTGIKNSEGQEFLNAEDEIVANYYKAGENWGDGCRFLQINKELLYRGLQSVEKNMVWPIRLLRKSSNKAFERYGRLTEERDRTWVVWYEGEKIKYKLFVDEVY